MSEVCGRVKSVLVMLGVTVVLGIVIGLHMLGVGEDVESEPIDWSDIDCEHISADD